MKAVLIILFSLFFVSVELNELKLLVIVLQKPPHFLSALKFYTFQRALAVIMIIQLSKNIWFIGVCVETESARTIRAQTAPVGWLIP